VCTRVRVCVCVYECYQHPKHLFRTHNHTCAHTDIHTHSFSFTKMHTHIHTHTQRLAHEYPLSLSLSLTHTHTRTHTHVHTNTRTHTQTQTQQNHRGEGKGECYVLTSSRRLIGTSAMIPFVVLRTLTWACRLLGLLAQPRTSPSFLDTVSKIMLPMQT